MRYCCGEYTRKVLILPAPQPAPPPFPFPSTDTLSAWYRPSCVGPVRHSQGGLGGGGEAPKGALTGPPESPAETDGNRGRRLGWYRPPAAMHWKGGGGVCCGCGWCCGGSSCIAVPTGPWTVTRSSPHEVRRGIVARWAMGLVRFASFARGQSPVSDPPPSARGGVSLPPSLKHNPLRNGRCVGFHRLVRAFPPPGHAA